MPLPADRFLPLFLACQNDLRAFIGAMVRDTALREDLFQEVSMILWRKFDTYDPARAFGAWARGIATRKILESHRVSARLPQAIPPEVLEAVAEGFNRVEQEEEAQTWQERERALNACLDLLPARSSALIAERYHKSRAIEELAEEFGMSLDGIYQTLSRLRRQLRECVSRRLRIA
ncbi:MAG: sigma-70 family RNA polymerase sigma factor [Verrucomicrobiaceae bacterium]|jgi:RNA polymerase sigma-70 factor (ECF subfamily)